MQRGKQGDWRGSKNDKGGEKQLQKKGQQQNRAVWKWWEWKDMDARKLDGMIRWHEKMIKERTQDLVGVKKEAKIIKKSQRKKVWKKGDIF